MKHHRLRLLALCLVPWVGACAEDDLSPTGSAVEINVAPLSLPGTLGVSYAVAVFNANPSDYTQIFDVNGGVQAANSGILVWQQPNLSSNQFGNGPGGDISYVGPCDASVDDNWVALALNRVDVGDTKGSYDVTSGAFKDGDDNLLDDQNSAFTASPGSNDLDPDFVNPAPYNKALVLKIECDENEDTRVTFNLTVMRDADQGFFDIAVNFEDIFCSMKIDTCTDEGPITLLFGDEADEGRVETAVIASACSAGTDDADTEMWMAPLQVSCAGGVTFDLDPTGGQTGSTAGEQGNQTCATAAGAAATAWGGLRIQGDSVGNVDLVGVTFTDTTSNRQYIARYVFQSTVDLAGNGSVIWAAEAAMTGTAGNADLGTLTFANYDIGNNQMRTITQVSDFTGGADAGSKTLCYALYWGKEDLQCDGANGSCNKGWWNAAINIDDLRDQDLKNCTVTTAITASSSTDTSPPRFVNGTLPGPGQTYGYVAFEAELTDNDGAPTCFQGPMGSGYAPVKYGATKDILNAEAFPQLCSFFTPGQASPRQLRDITDYFFDGAATLTDALYAGRIEAFANASGELVRFKKVRLNFVEMGAAIGGQCGSSIKNEKQVFYFNTYFPDGKPRQDLAWRGSGGNDLQGLVGTYSIQAFYRNDKVSDWTSLADPVSLDFSNADNQVSFAKGATFANSGSNEFAIQVTRTDDRAAESIGLTFGFVDSFANYVTATCSVSDASCTCYEGGVAQGLSTLECLDSVDPEDITWSN